MLVGGAQFQGAKRLSDQTRTLAPFSLIARFRSFGYAFSGIGFMLRTQHNAWLHLIATILVLFSAVALRLSASDWRWIVVAIFLVWSAEAFNTAVEYVCDMVAPDYNLVVKHAKDIAAGAVLLSAISAAFIGVLTFWPYLHIR
jgi:diacylglycerol kinase